MGKKIGFLSFRFAGTDGVSLETEKWATILEREGHECYYLSGESDISEECSVVEKILHFQHPDILKMNKKLFDHTIRLRDTTEEIHRMRIEIKQIIYDFINRFDIDLIIPENVLAIPLHIPFSLAITDFIAETGFPVIAHHHDLFWERKRFLRNCVWDYLNSACPPNLPSIMHVVINSSAQNQLAFRSGISSTIIPNIMDFASPPPPPDEYLDDLRKNIGIDKDEFLFLQPTRVVQRKGIEHAIELVSRMERKAALVISHSSGDEGSEYLTRVKDYIKLMGIKAIFADDIITSKERSLTDDNRKIYTLGDIYNCCDLVTYPSAFEGFGNAFLEAIYYKKPIFLNNYSIYYYDIKPKGFRAIMMDDFVSDATVEKVNQVLDSKEQRQRMVEKNYFLGQKYYSFEAISLKLNHLIGSVFGYKIP